MILVALNLAHQLADFFGILRIRIIGPEFLLERFAAVTLPQRELPSHVVDSMRERDESGPGRIPAPPIVKARMPATRTFPDRDGRKKPVVDRIDIGSREIVRYQERRRAMIRVKERFEPGSPDIDVQRDCVRGGGTAESDQDQKESKPVSTPMARKFQAGHGICGGRRSALRLWREMFEHILDRLL